MIKIFMYLKHAVTMLFANTTMPGGKLKKETKLPFKFVYFSI